MKKTLRILIIAFFFTAGSAITIIYDWKLLLSVIFFIAAIYNLGAFLMEKKNK